MFLLPIILLVASLLSESSANDGNGVNFSDVDGTNYRAEYDELNALLEANVGSSDVQANMDFATKDFYERTLGDTSEKVSSFLGAYRLFTGLSTFGPDVVCSPSNFNILTQNYRATGLHPSNVKPNGADKQSHRRIEQVVIEYATMYSRKCQDLYPFIMRDRLKLIDPKQKVLINQLSTFVLNEYKKIGLGLDTAGTFRLATSPSELKLKLFDKKFIYEALQNEVSLNSDYKHKYLRPLRDYSKGTDQLDERKFGKLFEEYLLSPCKGYIKVLEPVFNPANFLAFWQHKVIEDERVYYRRWVLHNICFILNENGMRFLSLAKSYASTLSRENSLHNEFNESSESSESD